MESAVTTVSWIPSEAVTGPVNKNVFDAGMTHYDDPLPDELGDLEQWKAEDRYRFANQLSAAIEVDEDGTITDAQYTGGLFLNATTVRVGKKAAVFQPISLPTIQADPVIEGGSATFVQTVGGRTGLPSPRRVNHPPFVQFLAPVVWTTLQLTINADGTSSHELTGASQFPRHWVYDRDGLLSEKAGLADFAEWFRHAFGKHTPWGDQDSPALVTAVESALERELAATIMRGGEKPSSPPGQGGRAPHRAGRGGRRAVPAPGRRGRRRGRRRADRRVRAGGDPGGARHPRGRPADVDDQGPHQGPRGRGHRRPDRRDGAGRAQ